MAGVEDQIGRWLYVRGPSFSRVPHEWKPPEVVREDGTRAESTAESLNIEAAKYKAMWGASDVPDPIPYQDNYPWPKLEPDRIRRVARAFKRRTGVAPDEWHPRHIALLSNEALEVLATLYLLLEKSGHLPNQQRFVCIFLIDKPSGALVP